MYPHVVNIFNIHKPTPIPVQTDTIRPNVSRISPKNSLKLKSIFFTFIELINVSLFELLINATSSPP